LTNRKKISVERRGSARDLFARFRRQDGCSVWLSKEELQVAKKAKKKAKKATKKKGKK
jgi:hypothetical protein